MFDPILGGVAAGAASGLVGALGAGSAAKKQARAAEEANTINRNQLEQSRRDSASYRGVGNEAQYRLGDLLGLNVRGPDARVPDGAMDVTTWAQQHGFNLPQHRQWNESELQNIYRSGYQQYLDGLSESQGQPSDFGSLNRKFTIGDFEADPVNQLGLKFGLDEGTKAIRRMLGAKGALQTGGAVKGLTRYATDYTGSKAAESRSRFIQDQDITFNRLSGVSGSGQTATANSAALGANTANNMAQNVVGAGNARGAAAIAGSNAIAAPIAAAGNVMTTKYLLDSMRPQYPQPSRFQLFGDD